MLFKLATVIGMFISMAINFGLHSDRDIFLCCMLSCFFSIIYLHVSVPGFPQPWMLDCLKAYKDVLVLQLRTFLDILPLGILFEYWFEHITLGLLCAMFRFPTRIFYRGVPGFATDCPCGVWCRVLTTFLLYFGPLFGGLVWNHSWFIYFI